MESGLLGLRTSRIANRPVVDRCQPADPKRRDSDAKHSAADVIADYLHRDNRLALIDAFDHRGLVSRPFFCFARERRLSHTAATHSAKLSIALAAKPNCQGGGK